MSTISDNLSQLKQLFAGIDDDLDRYSCLLECAALLPEAENLHQEGWLYRGCQSQVWLRASAPEGACVIEADSDTLLIRGVLFLFAALLEHVPPEELLAAQVDLLGELGLGSLFSSRRTTGIGGLLEEIKRQIGGQSNEI